MRYVMFVCSLFLLSSCSAFRDEYMAEYEIVVPANTVGEDVKAAKAVVEPPPLPALEQEQLAPRFASEAPVMQQFTPEQLAYYNHYYMYYYQQYLKQSQALQQAQSQQGLYAQPQQYAPASNGYAPQTNNAPYQYYNALSDR